MKDFEVTQNSKYDITEQHYEENLILNQKNSDQEQSNYEKQDYYEGEIRYTDIDSGFLEDGLTSDHNIPTFCLMAGRDGWPPLMVMDEEKGECVFYMLALQSGDGLKDIHEGFEFRTTLVAILITNGRTKAQRREIMSSMVQDLVHESYESEGHMIHSIDMKSDDVLISDKLPYNRWYEMFNVKGSKGPWTAAVENLFREKFRTLGLTHLLMFVRNTTGKTKLKPKKIKI